MVGEEAWDLRPIFQSQVRCRIFFTGQRLTEQTLGRAAQLERSVVTNLKSLTDRSSLLSRRPQTGTGKAMEARSSSCDPRIW